MNLAIFIILLRCVVWINLKCENNYQVSWEDLEDQSALYSCGLYCFEFLDQINSILKDTSIKSYRWELHLRRNRAFAATGVKI
jgi:hypothetical protein